MNIKLTKQQLIVLQEMNKGAYLIKKGTQEGLGYWYTISSTAPAGTIQKLLEYGLIRIKLGHNRHKVQHHILTDAGREYRKI